MSEVLTFTVVGTPRPQGSKTYLGGGRITEASVYLAGWREKVAYTARSAMPRGWVMRDQRAMNVTLDFYFATPKQAHPKYKASKPDIDKIVRAVLDGMTNAGVWKDDSQVVILSASKDYDTNPRVEVTVRPMN